MACKNYFYFFYCSKLLRHRWKVKRSCSRQGRKKNQKKTVKKRILLCFWAIEHLKIDKRYRHPSCKKALMEGWRHKSKRIGCERRTSLQPIILASLGKFNSKIIKLIVCLITRKLWKVAKFHKKNQSPKNWTSLVHQCLGKLSFCIVGTFWEGHKIWWNHVVLLM